MQIGGLSKGLSYDAASMSSVGRTNAPSSGGVMLTVLGRGGLGGNGSSVGVKVGGTAGGSVWRSDSGVLCREVASGLL